MSLSKSNVNKSIPGNPGNYEERNFAFETDIEYEQRNVSSIPKKADDFNITSANSTISLFTATVSCVSYIVTGVSMVLVNKAISYNMPPHLRPKIPELWIVLFQCLVAFFLVLIAKFFKFVDYPPFSFETARSWLPVNILFVTMLCTGFISLIYVSVPMVMIFKNLTHLGTALGDWYFFHEKITWLSVQAIFLMIIGAVFAGINDLEYNFYGYFWITINCIISAFYILYMRFATINIKLPRFGMVYYNNLISAVILLPLCLIRGDFNVLRDPEIMTTNFIIFNIIAGVIGFYLNFASLWCIANTSATAFAVVGSFNKVPVTILGFILFNAKMTTNGIIFVVLATLGSFLYAYAKLPSSNR